MRVYVRPS